MEQRCIPDQCPEAFRLAAQIADQAADQAVAKTFFMLGVDVANPKEVEEFRRDLRFGAKVRQLADKGMAGLITVAAGGLAIAIWAGVRWMVDQGPP